MTYSFVARRAPQQVYHPGISPSRVGNAARSVRLELAGVRYRCNDDLLSFGRPRDLGRSCTAAELHFDGLTAMRVFVLRARSAPTESHELLDAVGKEAHTEILAHTLMNAIFVAQSHRPDIVVYLVLESTRDYSRTISFNSNDMRDIGGFHEQALLGKVARALDVSRGMGKEESRPVESGITVRTISFEKLVQELAVDHPLFVMDKKGTPIRGKAIAGSPCFLLTDHMPMPKKSFNSLDRLGAEKISLGSKMLFASQCVLLIHNELDHREQ